MSLKVFHAVFSDDILRQPIIYPDYAQCASSLDLKKVQISDVNNLSSMSRACASCVCVCVCVCVCRRWSDDALKNAWKCPGPFLNAHLCIRPRVAMSRLHRRGAKLKWHSASSSDTPSSYENLAWKESKGVMTVSHACSLAALRYSIYDLSRLLWSFTNSPSVKQKSSTEYRRHLPRRFSTHFQNSVFRRQRIIKRDSQQTKIGSVSSVH